MFLSEVPKCPSVLARGRRLVSCLGARGGAAVQDLRGGVHVVGQPQVHPIMRIHGAIDRAAVPGLLQPGPGAPAELLAGDERGR